MALCHYVARGEKAKRLNEREGPASGMGGPVSLEEPRGPLQYLKFHTQVSLQSIK